ncbi:MAG TPA: isoprenyl transferase [Anaerolineales bacterium]|nr:isoprenyl transferase [Anaerolineales bacterium]
MNGQTSQNEIQVESTPKHIAIIMDGNGRWAQQRGLPRLLGHKAGTKNVRKIIAACIERGVRVLTLFAFSTENWMRPFDEVRGLMYLLGEYIDRETPHLHRMGVQIRHLGRKEGLSPGLQRKIRNAVELTKENSAITVCVALNYGGRNEIIHAIRTMVGKGIPLEEINEETFAAHLCTKDIPNPDLVIRTSGETRLSNFLIWETAYSEFWFTPIFWPDFTHKYLDQAIQDYASRQRRFGSVSVANRANGTAA